MFWFFVILVFVVWLVFHFGADAPKLKEQKSEQQQREHEYIRNNNITVSVEYKYEIEYIAKGSEWTQWIYYRYIVDDEHKKIYILGNAGDRIEIPFSELIGCEVLSDSQAVGGIKRAVMGGVIGGVAGALVGAATTKTHIMSYKIVIYKSDIQCPTVEIVLIKSKTST